MLSTPSRGAPLAAIPLHLRLDSLISMRYGPPGPEPTAGGDGWFLRRYELPGETWIEVEAYRPDDGLHAYLYVVDKPGFDMAVVVALDRGGQFLDLLHDESDPRAAALASRCPTAASLAREGGMVSHGYAIGLARHDRFGAHLMTFGDEPLNGRLTRQQFLWAAGMQVALEPLVDDLLFLSQVTATPAAIQGVGTPIAGSSRPLATAADFAEDVGRIASGASAVLAFLGSFL
jgi:hypothetical protein